METDSPADDLPPALPTDRPEASSEPEPLAESANEPAEITELALEPTADESVAGAAEAGPDELGQLADASQKARLSPADEERMAALLKEFLLGGRGGVARAIEALPKVPWIVGVRAVEAVWADLTAGFRTQLLSGLAKEETDFARRIRLSLARALFKIDVPVALKIAAAVAREMPDKDSGALTAKQAQIFANVFIGRGKPWLAQLPLAELKPADVDALVHSALVAVFTVPHPPVTQLGVVQWAQEQSRLGKLEPAALEAVKRGVGRWNGKWQAALRKEVADLPEEIVAQLRPLEETPPETPAECPARDLQAPADEAERSEPPAGVLDEDEEDDEEREEEEERSEEPARERPVYEPRPQKGGGESPRDRPVYTPRNAGANVPRNFNLTETLRQIEAYANSLRAEIATARSRQKEDRRRPEKSSGPIIVGEPTLEELARLNQQLEARNIELQERINDLTQHSEDLATSMGAMSSEPVADGGAQLRTLLGLKLQEDYADFLALKEEANDIVIQQHYRGLLEHVFEVLQQLEVPLKAEG